MNHSSASRNLGHRFQNSEILRDGESALQPSSLFCHTHTAYAAVARDTTAVQIQSLFEPTHSKPTKIALQATPGELVPHGEQGRACYAKEPTSTLCAHLPEDGLIPMCADVGGAREALLVQRAATVSLLTEEEWRRMASDATSVRRLNVVALSFLRTI